MSTRTPETVTTHVEDLVDFATRAGQLDVYAGKRDKPRYRLRMPMEIRLKDSPEDQIISVELHDISLGGIGFWSESILKADTQILVREWRPDEPAGWIPARVLHCTRGLTGYLLGAQFSIQVQRPTPPEEAVAEGSVAAAPPAASEAAAPVVSTKPHAQFYTEAAPTQWSLGPGISLRTKCTIIAASTAVVGGLMTALVLMGNLAGGPLALLIPCAFTMALAFGGGLMWALLGDESRYLGAVRRWSSDMAAQQAWPQLDQTPPSGDLEAVHRLLASLRDALAGRGSGSPVADRAALAEFENNVLNMVAHDLRTPLTSILLYSELLRSELHQLDAEAQSHFLQVIGIETQRLSRLIDNLTTVRERPGGEGERTSDVALPSVIDECVRDYIEMAQAKSIHLEVDCDPKMPAFASDRGLVGQIISNLLANAIKFTPEGGTVHLSADTAANEVFLCVSDNGPGIPRQFWDRIFDRFAQTKPTMVADGPGVGVGLFVVRQLVDQLGGRIWLDSVVGKGTEFCVTLPKTPPADAAAQGESRGAVLVCDADAEVVSRVEQWLRAAGYTVYAAHSGERLLERLKERPYDVVFTDILLHDAGPDDLLPTLCRADRQFKLIIHTHTREATTLRQRGADMILARPAARAELVQAVELATTLRPNCATLMIVANESDDLFAYGQKLASEGHLPVMVANLRDATEQLPQYPFDRVLISENQLSRDWSELRELIAAAGRSDLLVVVCAALGRRERQLAEAFGVGAGTARAMEKLVQMVSASRGVATAAAR